MRTTIKIGMDRIKVLTPVPYTITIEPERLKETRHQLDNAVKFLRNCLKVLDVSKNEAIKQGYTLNIDTGEKLSNLSWKKNNISFEVKTLIRNYYW